VGTGGGGGGDKDITEGKKKALAGAISGCTFNDKRGLGDSSQ